MFKEKTSKKRLHTIDNNKELSTLDAMHINIIKNYNVKLDEEKNINSNILDLLNIQSNINNDILNLNKDQNIDNSIYDNLWNSNIKIKEEIIKLNKYVKEINNFDEIEYYEKTSQILFNYYDMLEKQSSINNIKKIKFNNKFNNK